MPYGYALKDAGTMFPASWLSEEELCQLLESPHCAVEGQPCFSSAGWVEALDRLGVAPARSGYYDGKRYLQLEACVRRLVALPVYIPNKDGSGLDGKIVCELPTGYDKAQKGPTPRVVAAWGGVSHDSWGDPLPADQLPVVGHARLTPNSAGWFVVAPMLKDLGAERGFSLCWVPPSIFPVLERLQAAAKGEFVGCNVHPVAWHIVAGGEIKLGDKIRLGADLPPETLQRLRDIRLLLHATRRVHAKPLLEPEMCWLPIKLSEGKLTPANSSDASGALVAFTTYWASGPSMTDRGYWSEDGMRDIPEFGSPRSLKLKEVAQPVYLKDAHVDGSNGWQILLADLREDGPVLRFDDAVAGREASVLGPAEKAYPASCFWFEGNWVCSSASVLRASRR